MLVIPVDGCGVAVGIRADAGLEEGGVREVLTDIDVLGSALVLVLFGKLEIHPFFLNYYILAFAP